MSFIDDLLGSLMQELDRLQLKESTTIVFFSDHGFHLGDHGGLWAKLSAFERSTRVPLILAGAGAPRGKVVDTPVELLDVYPTLVELAGLKAPEKLDGVSLTPALRGEALTGRRAASMVFHYDQPGKRDVLSRTIIDRNWRYTEWDRGTEGREFYSRATDPGEYRNRSGDAAVAPQLAEARAVLARLPEPKPGPANRPRAMLPADSEKKKKKS